MYHDKFCHLAKAYESCSGSIGNAAGLIEKQLETSGLTLKTGETNQATVDQVQVAEATVKEQYMGCLFLLNADRGRYSGVL